MLRDGKSKSCVELPAAVPKTSKNKPTAGGSRNSDSEPELEGYVPAPTFSQSFSDAIALALEKAVANKETPKGKLSAVLCWFSQFMERGINSALVYSYISVRFWSHHESTTWLLAS
jgi:hypothetical protein